MRIALIADIHGNRIALEAVLRDSEKRQVDFIWCLGDVAVLGPDPGGCIDVLAHHHILTIQGNVDAWLVDESEEGSSVPLLREMTDWARRQLSDEQLAWLSGLSQGANEMLVGGRHFVLSHGSPRSFDDVVAADTPNDDLKLMFASIETQPGLDLVIGGHTHIPLLRRWNDATLINPGSVGLPGVGPGTPGLPVNAAPTWVEYAIVELDEVGQQIVITFRRVALPMDEMIAAAREMPGFSWWRALWG